jgi:hypothetical protein
MGDQKKYNNTEPNLSKIIRKILMEQMDVVDREFAPTIIDMTKELDKINKKYYCVPGPYKVFTDELVKKGFNKKFLKAALGIIGRESDYGGSARYFAKEFARFIGKPVGSHGMAQMKSDTAKRFNVDPDTVQGSLLGAYRYLIANYNLAKSQGYSTNSPSSNYDKGTGDAALDISILAYNAGERYIKKYCATTDPKLKNDCANAGKTVQLKYGPKVKVTNKLVKNYLPYLKSSNKKHYTGLLTSWGYVKEVAERMKKLNCF